MSIGFTLRTRVRRLVHLAVWLIMISHPPVVWGQIPGVKPQSSSSAPAVSKEAGEQALTRLEEALTLARQRSNNPKRSSHGVRLEKGVESADLALTPETNCMEIVDPGQGWDG